MKKYKIALKNINKNLIIFNNNQITRGSVSIYKFNKKSIIFNNNQVYLNLLTYNFQNI